MAINIRFNVSFRRVTSGLKLDGGQNEVAFINRGATTCWVNDFEIAPLQTLSISGNLGEVFAGSWLISFDGGVGVLDVAEKKYLHD
jgi:hypothetical protein